MARDDDERPRPKPVHEVGQDLSLLSVDELGGRIDALKAEIARLEATMTKKRATRDAAAGFFKS
jgi:uncharacterized small protein (DUF1192 family)